jgi:hypothetical protein
MLLPWLVLHLEVLEATSTAVASHRVLRAFVEESSLGQLFGSTEAIVKDPSVLEGLQAYTFLDKIRIPDFIRKLPAAQC